MAKNSKELGKKLLGVLFREDADILQVDSLIKDGADLNFQNNNSATALSMSLQYHKYDIASLLIEAGANVNVQDRYNGTTPLMDTCLRKNIPGIKFLLKAGANPEIPNKEGKNALQIANDQGLTEIASLIKCFIPFENLLNLKSLKDYIIFSLDDNDIKLLKSMLEDKINSLTSENLFKLYEKHNIEDHTFNSYKNCLIDLAGGVIPKDELNNSLAQIKDIFFRHESHNAPFVDILRTLKGYFKFLTKTKEENKSLTPEEFLEIQKLVNAPLDYILEQLESCNNITMKMIFSKSPKALECFEYIADKYQEIEELRGKIPNYNELIENIEVLNLAFDYDEINVIGNCLIL